MTNKHRCQRQQYFKYSVSYWVIVVQNRFRSKQSNNIHPKYFKKKNNCSQARLSRGSLCHSNFCVSFLPFSHVGFPELAPLATAVKEKFILTLAKTARQILFKTIGESCRYYTNGVLRQGRETGFNCKYNKEKWALIKSRSRRRGQWMDGY